MSVVVKVIIMPGGKMQVFVDGEGLDFATAQNLTRQAYAALQAGGFPVQEESEIEQHKPDGIKHVHVVGFNKR